MHNTRRALLARPSLHALIALGGSALVIIVGLLGMHTLNAASSGHGAAPSHHAAVVTTHLETETGETLLGTECDAGCHANTVPGHEDMMTACVLALLVGMLFLAPPTLLQRFGALPTATANFWRFSSTSVLPRPPSLLVLSISRT